MPGGSPWVIDVTVENFEKDVVLKSQEVPVVLDFWAPWCGPCRQLGPILEKLAQEAAGKWILGKINTDEQQQLAAAFGIQSIPLVVAFRDAQPVDQFMGLLPEAEIRQWLEKLLPSPAQVLVQEARALEATDPKAAEAKYRAAMDLLPDDDSLKISLARVLLAQSRFDDCRSLLTALETRGYLEPDAERLKSELDVRVAALETGGVEAARRAAEANPQDLTLQIHFADALAASQQHRKALEILLNVVEQDKAGAGVEAKSTMLKVFDMLGPASDLTSEFRRKLATALY